jgi:DNA-directed RNA polymerase specialized sigma24 family protein
MHLDELAQLFLKYKSGVVGRASHNYDNVGEADLELLYSELWERVVANSDIIRREGFRNYLFICLTNRIKDYLRQRERSDDLLTRDPSIIVSLNEKLD